MVKRRRKLRQTRSRNVANKRGYRSRNKKSLKERLLTAAIWALVLINLVLITSIASDYFASPNETSVNIGTPGSEKESSKPDPILEETVVTIEVLNACNVQGLARRTTEYLRKNPKFDVQKLGNYPGGSDLQETLVIDRVSMTRENAKKVASVLGVKDEQVIAQMETSVQLKVTVLLGKDYKSLKFYKDFITRKN